MTPSTPLRTSAEISGMGHSMKRKEDPRFIRGQGTFVDDVQLPGMIHLDIVRSPYAHATITNIDAAPALATPGVLAVITGKDLDAAGLAWMPTLMSDKQMVLPVDTVLYQSQEVAAVVADSRYAAADGIAAVLVDYEPLPVVVDPKKGPRARRADHPLRSGGEVEPDLALGGRRPRRHRPRLSAGRRGRSAGHVHTADPRRVYRDVRVRGQFRQRERPPHRVDDHPGAARDPHRLLAGEWDC